MSGCFYTLEILCSFQVLLRTLYGTLRRTGCRGLFSSSQIPGHSPCCSGWKETAMCQCAEAASPTSQEPAEATEEPEHPRASSSMGLQPFFSLVVRNESCPFNAGVTTSTEGLSLRGVSPDPQPCYPCLYHRLPTSQLQLSSIPPFLPQTG